MAIIAVLADDLTGTLDCAVQFSKQNIEVSVCGCGGAELSLLKSGAPVVAVNTDSRHISPEEAAGRVESAARLAVEAGVRFFYKKIDSLLRGNIGAECEALMRASGCRKLFLLPSFPENGRFTRGGSQYYGDKPVTESVLGADRFSKQLSSNLPELFRLQGCAVRTRVVSTSEPLPEEEPEEPTVYIFDADTGEQLRERALELRSLGAPWTAAGCAGFAEYIPLAASLRRGAVRRAPTVSRALVVSGSMNPISLEQVRNVDRAGYRVLYLSYERLRSSPELLGDAVDTARKELGRSGAVIIATSGEADGEELIKGKDAMCGIVSSAAAGIIRDMKDCALVVFGGDTSLGIIREVGAKEILPVSEISPGVVFSVMVLDDGSETALITKSGGFGEKDAIIDILNYLNIGGGTEYRQACR